MGGGDSFKFKVNSLLGNFFIKIFYVNNDFVINEWVFNVIGKVIIIFCFDSQNCKNFVFMVDLKGISYFGYLLF